MPTAVPAGGQARAKTNAPLALMSRVRPSPCRRILFSSTHEKVTGACNGKRTALLKSTETPSAQLDRQLLLPNGRAHCKIPLVHFPAQPMRSDKTPQEAESLLSRAVIQLEARGYFRRQSIPTCFTPRTYAESVNRRDRPHLRQVEAKVPRRQKTRIYVPWQP